MAGPSSEVATRAAAPADGAAAVAGPSSEVATRAAAPADGAAAVAGPSSEVVTRAAAPADGAEAAAAADGATNAWVVTHTKPCPKCALPIEKATGCNHMTCAKSGRYLHGNAAAPAGGCGAEFCWLCGGSWAEHLQVRACRELRSRMRGALDSWTYECGA